MTSNVKFLLVPCGRRPVARLPEGCRVGAINLHIPSFSLTALIRTDCVQTSTTLDLFHRLHLLLSIYRLRIYTDNIYG